MKWTLLTALVVGIGVASPSYGAGLLDRMLGSGCGYDTSCAQLCCEKPCGAAAEADCGCPSDPGCGCPDACDCDAEPSCGCDAAPSCCQTCCKPPRSLFEGLFCCKKKSCCGCGAEPSCGCDVEPSCGCDVEPSCGCDAAPSCCAPARRTCGRRRSGGLLAGLFCCKKKKSCCGCAAPSCGCGVDDWTDEAEAEPDDAPLPPAPMADPNARLGRRRFVVQTSVTR